MNHNFKLRQTQLAVVTLGAIFAIAAADASLAAEKAKAKPAGTYVTGDFHNHTTCSDGTLSMKKLIDKSAGTFNLDWFVQADHGGSSARNCTIAEDPFEPVAPALGIPSANTIASGGQPLSAGKGPNQYWETTLPAGRAGIKGDGTATPKAMWRWQEIKEYQYAVTETESQTRKKPIWIGLEQNVPGHEHSSTVILKGQTPWPALAGGNAALQAQYEYCFDRSDSDTSRGAENLWDCTVPGSANNTLIDATARKITGNNASATANLGHTKTVEGVKWMAAVAPLSSYFVPAHLERAGAYNPTGSNGYNIEHLRDFNNAAPSVAFGFESMPGHQADPNRGSYSTSAVGGGTFGGTGVYAAAVGGVWDALLGEGRNWFFFASSDYHNRGTFGPDQRESNADFFPGEYTRDHVMVRKGSANLSAEDIIAGLRSGNSFVANGGLIDRMSFVVCAYNPVLPRSGFNALVAKATQNAINNNAEVRIDGCATMGEKLKVARGMDLLVSIAVRNPKTNYSPYTFPNPSLKQINITQALNAPVLDHIDLIGGNVTGIVSPSDSNYAGVLGSAAATNTSAGVKRIFNASNWVASADGKTLTMSYKVPAVAASQYFRLRGTNLPAATPGETDTAGNPLSDFVANPSDQTAVGLIPCNDSACPSHMRTVAGQKYSSFDVAAWSDLWFYSNPVFVEVVGSTAVVGVK
jgi:hypothetical protein